MILLFFGKLEVEAVGCEYLGVCANVLPTCSVYGFQIGMILLLFGELEVEAVGSEYLGRGRDWKRYASDCR
jgi:hypothetical protein